ncbi:Ferric siderophore transport system, periplasmic binding protein TonB [Myxococcus hansupus]|uniref:Ferric siderophore transport system, periplasmic binding protein TonB n=1 Tax=Pseudomyxococcus hansupus TaxID=1297742 RepID=A0A0H4WVB5_9BACT|nr:energy transducer TonB [Myxococcus hansupus]AKQ67346.1 Ferric siderophore transport system, periplasmic binding protein TonB [Myxococcus hansupus]
MFKSVIEKQRAGRLGTGVWVSAALHAALFGAVLFISARAPGPVEPKEPPELVLRVQQAPRVAKGSPAPAQPRQANAPRPRPRNRDRVPSRVPPPVVDAPPPPVEPVTSPDNTSDTDELATPGTGTPGGHPDGYADSNVIGVPFVPGLLPGDGDGGGTGTDILPFGSGMTPPRLLGSPGIEYTHQALAARVEGTMIAKCVITVRGDVTDCRVIKGLAHMNESVLEALHNRRYSPVEFQGRPVSVSYTFTLKLKLPR